jgi:hypothetical protein
MEITQEEMNRRLNSTKNLINKLNIADNQGPSIVRKPMHVYTPTAPKEVKILAAALVASGAAASDVGKELGLSLKQVASEKNNPVVLDTMERVRNLALDKMLIAMGLMTQDKFENATLKDLAATCGSLSRVIEKTQSRDSGPIVQFIVHAPQAKSMGSYQTIDV